MVVGSADASGWLDEAEAAGAGSGAEQGRTPWWFQPYRALHEQIRQGTRPPRYVVWTCRSLQPAPAPGSPLTAAGSASSAGGDAPWRREDVYDAPGELLRGASMQRVALAYTAYAPIGTSTHRVCTE